MTVVLAGIGADTTNLGALGPLYADGRFEYVPIPEKTRETTESKTLGSWAFRYDDRTAADLATRIRPRPVREKHHVVTGEAVAEWPVHRDPNFEALTYGEHRTTGYLGRLRALEPGDVVGFYAGLRGPDDRAHRYLIGYMTVAEVTVVTPDMDDETRRRLLARHPDNAHTKRAQDGRPYLAEKSLVIVDGCRPGGLFERHPIRLSEYTVKPGNTRAGYYLRESIAAAWNVVEGGRNMAYKPAYRCNIRARDFVSAVGRPGDRPGDAGPLEARALDPPGKAVDGNGND